MMGTSRFAIPAVRAGRARASPQRPTIRTSRSDCSPERGLPPESTWFGNVDFAAAVIIPDTRDTIARRSGAGQRMARTAEENGATPYVRDQYGIGFGFEHDKVRKSNE